MQEKTEQPQTQSQIKPPTKPYARLDNFCAELRRMAPDTWLPFQAPANWVTSILVDPSTRFGRDPTLVSRSDPCWNCLRITRSAWPKSCTAGQALEFLDPCLRGHASAGVCMTSDGCAGAMLDPSAMFDPPTPIACPRTVDTMFRDTDWVREADHPSNAPATVLAMGLDDPAAIAALLVAKKWDWSRALFVVQGRPGPLTEVDVEKSYPLLCKESGWRDRMCELHSVTVEGVNIYKSTLHIIKGNHVKLVQMFGAPPSMIDEYLSKV